MREAARTVRRILIVTLLASAVPGRTLALGPTYTMSTYPWKAAELYDIAAGTWTRTADLLTPRAHHAAVALASGEALVAGGAGLDGGRRKEAELYDPATRAWIAVPPTEAYVGALALLPSGRVLATGVLDDGASAAQIFDPAARTWSAPERAPFVTGDVATRLATGVVLVDGAALYDEPARRWRAVAAAPVTGTSATAIAALRDGTALVTFDRTAFLYDPATDAWRATGPLPASCAGLPYCATTFDAEPGRHALTLADGRAVVLVGNHVYSPLGGGGDAWTGEVYDPSAGSWIALSGPGDAGAMALLPSGAVLISGGGAGGWLTWTSQVLDPFSTRWTSTTNLNDPRADHTATVLGDGTVLVAGGLRNQLVAVPQAVTVDPGGRISFAAYGGAKEYGIAASYAWSLARNGSGAKLDAATGVYVAGCGAEGDTTDVIDVHNHAYGFDADATATVTVQGAALGIRPAASTAAPGDAISFAVPCGGTTNAWSIVTNASGATIDGASGAYVAGSACGAGSKDVVQVTTATGRTALATVAVPCSGAAAEVRPASGCASGEGGGAAGLAALLAAAAARAWRSSRRRYRA